MTSITGTNCDRLQENIDIFDFELSAGEMQTLASMDKAAIELGSRSMLRLPSLSSLDRMSRTSR